MNEKWKSILKSSRFASVAAGVLLIVLNDVLDMGLGVEQVGLVVSLIVAFVIGRTFKPDEGQTEPAGEKDGSTP